MEPLTSKEIEFELKTLTQKHVLLVSLFGLLVGILQKEITSVQLMSKLSLLVEELKPLAPTAPASEWDGLLKLVNSFSEIAASRN
jgi:hypothetical protein